MHNGITCIGVLHVVVCKKWEEETAGFKKAKALFPHKCVGEKFLSYNKNVQNGQRSTKSSWIPAVITLIYIGD